MTYLDYPHPDAHECLLLVGEYLDVRPGGYGDKGDEAHTYGYHRGLTYCGPDDYSAQYERDLAQKNKMLVSAWDHSFTPEHMILATQRIKAAWERRDPRLLKACRQFHGTLDGRNVWSIDLATGDTSPADPSHLWHTHCSHWRDICDNREVLLGLVEVYAGLAPGTLTKEGDWLDMATEEDVRRIVREENKASEARLYKALTKFLLVDLKGTKDRVLALFNASDKISASVEETAIDVDAILAEVQDDDK